MKITVKDPHSDYQLCADLRSAAVQMNAREQTKLFKRMGMYISDEDCQRAMDDLASAILESRKHAAQQIYEGKWPVEVLERFAKAQLSIVMSVCKKPEILINYEREKEKK